jgi:hypothetical protein
VNNQSTSGETKIADKLNRQEALELEKESKETKQLYAKHNDVKKMKNRRAENRYKTIQTASQNLNAYKVGSTLKAMSKRKLRQSKKTRLSPKELVLSNTYHHMRNKNNHEES